MINDTMNTTTGFLGDVSSQTFLTTGILTSLIALVPIVILVFTPKILEYYGFIRVRGLLKKMAKKTNRSVVVMAHMETGLFGSMITISDLVKLESIMKKLKGKDFDLLLHTPGGDLFSSIKIARLIKNYPGKVRAIIPSFAMSGGTMTALATDEIFMSDTACLGPIDPQLGGLFSMHSARAWNEVIKVKGKKAKDDSIALNFLGKQATENVKTFAKKLVGKNKKLLDKMVKGDIMHSHQFDGEFLRKHGLKVKKLKSDLPMRIIDRFPKNKTVVWREK